MSFFSWLRDLVNSRKRHHTKRPFLSGSNQSNPGGCA